MGIKGVDVSLYQGDFKDYSLLKNEGFKFAIIKISEGLSTDRCFEQHYSNCEKYGIARGVYVYSHANSISKAKAEAQYILDVLKGRSLEMPIFMDLESSDINYAYNHNIMPWVTAFAEVIKAGGYRFGTYSNQSWYVNKLDINQLKEMGAVIWVAAYNGTSLSIPHDIRQYENEGKIPNYNGKFDFNLLFDESIIKMGDDSEVNPDPEPEPEPIDPPIEEKPQNGVLIKSEEHAKQLLAANFIREVGWYEKATNSQLYDKTANRGNKNWNKYADYIDRNYPNFYNGRKNGYPYCEVGVDCGFICTFGYENALKLLCQPEKSTGAGCSNSAQFYRENGQLYLYPEFGDQVYFGDLYNEGHTGFVLEVNGKKIKTFEANTSANPWMDADGDGCFIKEYDTGSYYIPCYGRPDYSILVGQVVPNLPIAGAPDEIDVNPNSPEDNEDSNTGDNEEIDVFNRPMVSYGHISNYVSEIQNLLISKGYSCGSSGADGIFGTGTYYAVKAFQKDNNLEVDGVVGPATWKALLEENDEESGDGDTETPSKPIENWNTPKTTMITHLPLLQFKDKDSSVKSALILLKEKGYYDKEIKEEFDEDVKRSVMGFQADNRLETDGMIGSSTWKKLIY